MRRGLRWSAVAVAAVVALYGCQREQRRFSEVAPAGTTPEPGTSFGAAMASPPSKGPYEGNAWAVSQGERLYRWFNCSGCHANGGGGIGPALMDARWLYGSDPASVFASIVAGRPNGMPAFGGRISPAQAWQLVAYVRSLSGQLSKDVSGGRLDHMQVKPSEQSTPRERPWTTGRQQTGESGEPSAPIRPGEPSR